MELIEGNAQRRWMATQLLKPESLLFEALVCEKELVRALGVSESFVNKLMAEEGLPHFKMGRAVRFRVSDISKWLDRRRH